MGQFQDLTDMRFGNWTAIRRAVSNNISNHTRWVCFCDCGKAVEVLSSSLKSGKSTNCGCVARKRLLEINTTHSKSKTAEYTVWANMIQRCTNKHATRYMYYGGRGITVCERWLNFENFLKDMGKKPSPEYSIERMDVNGNYTPENCRWATFAEQCKNRRSNKVIAINGVKKGLSDWLDELNIKRCTYYGRLGRGWSEEDALTIPVSSANKEVN